MPPMLHRLRALVSGTLSDDQIARGLSLTPTGFAKLARRLGLPQPEAEALFRSLAEHLKRGDALSEDSLRQDLNREVTAEPDSLGNMTIRDKRTGKSAFVRSATPTRVLAKMAKIEEADRAMTPDEEDPDEEAPHWEAHRQTGFYGAQGSGCIVLARDTGRILLALRSGEVEQPHTWGNFGGAMASGGDPKRNAQKELYQETGYTGQILDMIPLYQFEKGSFRYSNFLAIVPSEFEPHLNWEADDAEWCTFGDWPSPLHFGLKALFGDAPSVATIRKEIGRAGQGLTEARQVLDEDTYDAEIRQSGAGTYNFPWSLPGRQGFGMARFDGTTITVKRVSDMTGKPVTDLDPSEVEVIRAQAIDFIDEA